MKKNKAKEPFQTELDKAWDLYQNNKTKESTKLVLSLLKKHPNVISIIVLKAYLDFDINNFVESINGFKKCIELDTENKNKGHFNYWIGRVYDYYTYDQKNELYDSDIAESYYKLAIKCKNYPPDLLLKLYRINENFKDKEKILLKGINEFPDYINFYINLFNIRSKSEKEFNLLETLQKGFSNTKSYTISFLIGKYFEEIEDYEKAEQNYISTLEIISDDLDKTHLYYSLSIVYLKKNQLEKSLSYYNKLLKNKSENNSLSLSLEILYWATRNEELKTITDLLDNIGISKEVFNLDFEEKIIFLESEYTLELNSIIDTEYFERELKSLKKLANSNEFQEKLNLILLRVLKHNSKHLDRFRIARNLLKKNYSTYLIDEYLDCFTDYTEYIIENKKSYETLYKNVLTDINEYPSLKDKIVNSYSIKLLIDHLFENKEFEKISNFGDTLNNDNISKIDFWFSLAYSYSEIDNNKKAEQSYLIEIENSPNSSACFNNLSLIYEKEKKYDDALKSIIKAKNIEPDKELYERNFNRIKKQLDEAKLKQQSFQLAINNLSKETDFAIDKLNNFINNIKTDKDFNNNEIAIANWKFTKLIGTNKEIADSLKNQWLDNGYIEKTDQRTENNVAIYFINPLLKASIEKITICKIDDKWINGFTSISKETLKEIEYFDNIIRVNNIDEKFRDFILRDYKELTINYLIKNEKATLILAGSLTEYLLTYYCEKNNIETITYLRKGEKASKKLYDCVLNDLINYFENNSLLKTEFYHLNNLSRIYRNFVHPGKELRDVDGLTMNKAKICFMGVTELMKKIIPE